MYIYAVDAPSNQMRADLRSLKSNLDPTPIDISRMQII